VAGCTSIFGAVLSMSKLTLSSSPTSAVPGEFDGASEAATLMKYVPSGTDVVSHTKIGSVSARWSIFQDVSPSRRYITSNWSRSSFSSSAFQTNVCRPFW
jgi:hypothetical protein